METGAGRGGKTLMLLALGGCVYQLWVKWRVEHLISTKLQGKVVLITGASSGLGEALARVFYAAGSKVILASRNLQKLQQLKFQLDNEPRRDLRVQCNRYSPKLLSLDLADAASLAHKCQEAIGFYGRVDILVNNAGISSRGCVHETDMAVVRKIMEVNFFGTVALTKGLLPSMLEQGGGSIVVISSIQGKIGLPHRSSYSASKHALQGYCDSLRCELSPHRVSMLVVSPGYIATQLSLNALSADGTRHGVMDPSTAHGMTPQRAARAILEAVAWERRELILAKPVHHLAVYLGVLWPSLLDWVLNCRVEQSS